MKKYFVEKSVEKKFRMPGLGKITDSSDTQTGGSKFCAACDEKECYFYIGASQNNNQRPYKDVKKGNIFAPVQYIRNVVKMKTSNPKKAEDTLLEKWFSSPFCLNNKKKSGFTSRTGYVYVAAYSGVIIY